MDRGIIGLALASWVLGDLDDCENYAKQVLDSKDVTVKMLAYRYLSLVDSERENYLDALSNIKISSSIAISMNNKEALKTNYMHQGNIYKSLERLDSALVLYDLHFALKDSLFNEDVAGGIKDMFVKLERKQAQIEIDAQEKQLENQKVVVLLLALVIVLTAILVWFIIRDLLKRKKRNLMLGNEVSYKTLQLQKSNEELFENKNDLENLIYRISHDIRAPLARLQGLVEIGKMDNSIDIHAKFEKELNDLEKILTRMAVVNSINNHKVSLVKLELSLFINSLTDKYLPQWGDVVDFDINTNGASVNTDPELLDIALFNMLDNAVRNRATGQRAKVKIGYVNKVLYIEDLGEGFDPQFINRITELFFVANDKGGTGIGLHHALLAIKRFGGSLSIKSTSNPTRFEIHFSSKNI